MMYRSRKLLELAKDAPCMHCATQDGTVIMAHSNQLRDGKGRSLKAHDYRVALLCAKCHYLVDESKELPREQKVEIWEAAHRKTIAWLFDNNHVTVK